ncbi:MAG: hypothetical protein MN733_00650 [Nitrososphaera sp.]|nr:hypothetical protein [Nitrososphaera sp.]
MSKTFEIITYDVLGNEDDGYFVNDFFRTGAQITLTERQFANDKLLARVLAKKVTFHKASDLEIGGDEFNIVVEESATGKPLFELRLNERDRDRILAGEVL